MTDDEFDTWWETQTDTHILEYFGRHARRLWDNYIIRSADDLRACVENDQYRRKTGRE